MRIGRMLRDGAPYSILQSDQTGPWAWIGSPLSANPIASEVVRGDASMGAHAAIAPRLLVGTANTPRSADTGATLTVFLKSPNTVAADGVALTARKPAGVFAETEIAVVLARTMSTVAGLGSVRSAVRLASDPTASQRTGANP